MEPRGATTVQGSRPVSASRRRPGNIAGCGNSAFSRRELRECRYVHSRFLSVIAWKRKAYIRVVGHGGGSQPSRVGGRREAVGLRVTYHPGYDATDFPAPTTQQQDLAVALYREAIGLEDATYRFLGLFRILNITLGAGPAQAAWINAHLADLVAYPAERAREIDATKGDVGRYLYQGGRSALAHAAIPPVVDPDVMSDTHRIGLDGLLVEALVHLYMEKVLGLPHYD